MLLKILFRFLGKPPITRLFEIANVLHSQDDIGILIRTVLQKKKIRGFENFQKWRTFYC